MTNHYKGVRITELLEDIALWQSILENTKTEVETEAEVIQVVEAEATMAIMKAKLTALSANEVPSVNPRKQQGEK